MFCQSYLKCKAEQYVSFIFFFFLHRTFRLISKVIMFIQLMNLEPIVPHISTVLTLTFQPVKLRGTFLIEYSFHDNSFFILCKETPERILSNREEVQSLMCLMWFPSDLQKHPKYQPINFSKCVQRRPTKCLRQEYRQRFISED